MDIGFDILKGFLLRRSSPLDARLSVIDQTDRLAIQYPYKGMKVKQLDTGQIYHYLTTTPVDGSVPSNIAGDWESLPQIYSGTATPATTLGVIGDLYIDENDYDVYKKTGATTWTLLFSISGSQILTGVGVPGGGTGSDGDMYIRSEGSLYTKAVGVWTFQFSIRGDNGVSDKYATTSATSLDMTTVVAPLNITVGTGLNYTVGQIVIVASRSVPTKFLTGTITVYTTGSGAMTLSPITPAGAAGAQTDWDVNLNGAIGRQGKAFIHTEQNITFNEAKVTAVEAGSWTVENPWSASIQNDDRVSLIAPVELSGDMTGNSIAYDGLTWYNNGRWLGFTGATGPTGPGYNGVTLVGSSSAGNTYNLNPINGAGAAQILAPKGPSGNLDIEIIDPNATLWTIAYFKTLKDRAKKHYHILAGLNSTIRLGGGNEVGTMFTISRSVVSGNNPPLDTEFGSSTIVAYINAVLIYKGKTWTTTIALKVRSITFMVISNITGVNTWVCIGEETT